MTREGKRVEGDKKYFLGLWKFRQMSLVSVFESYKEKKKAQNLKLFPVDKIC